MVTKTNDIKSQVEYYSQLPYTVTLERMDDQGTYYVARYIELPDLLMTGDTPEEALAELEKVKPEWIETHLELGNKMPVPLKIRRYSGEYRLRMPPSLHEQASLMAELEGVSLNQYTVIALSRAVGRDEIIKSKPKKARTRR
jgi:predicted HicB family RNase H-like nuclease